MATNKTGRPDGEPVAGPSASPFSYGIFRAVWIASLASNFGGLIQSVGASWMMISLSGSPQMVALVQASTAAPIVLLSLLSGAIADNMDRRRVMLTAQILMLTTSAALAACAFAGLLSPATLLLFTFLIGCGTALNSPAWQASVGDMVPRPALPGAIALNSMGFNIARSIGPAIGGLIVAAGGAAAAFTVNALTYLGLITVLSRWKPQLPPRLLPPERIDMAMAAGVRYVWMSPNIRRVLLRAGLFGIAASAVPALMPLVARDLVTGGPLSYGLLLGAFGVGAVVGAFSTRYLRQRLSTENMVRAAATIFALAAIITGLSPSIWLTFPALVLGGAGWVLALSTFNVTVQLSAPRWVVARALSLYQMAAFGGMALGAWLFGWMADHQGIATALVSAGVLQLLVAAIGLFLPLPVVEELNLDPLARWREPQTAVPVQARSGPIIITIDWRIREADVATFLQVMGERRRIRRRDGARHWTLLRDLGEPDLWIERYGVATWLEYVRVNQRRTHADAANAEQIMALHIGPEPPRVHRRIERQTTSLPGNPPAEAREMSAPLTDATGSA